MTKEEKEDLMIDCLLEMNLPKENVRAIATILKKEEQINIMLNWIKKHFKEKPHKLRVMLVVVAIRDGINSETTDALINKLNPLFGMDTMTSIVMAMETNNQMSSMLNWIGKHYKENLSEKEVIQAAEKIKEEVVHTQAPVPTTTRDYIKNAFKK